MKEKLFITFTVLLLLLVSCRSELSTQIPVTKVPLSVTLSAKESPTAVSSITPIVVDTVPPTEAHLTIQCLDIEPSIPLNANLHGSIVLHDRNLPDRSLMSFGKRDAYILNMVTEEKVFLAKKDAPILFVTMSPNGNFIAFLKRNEPILEVTSNTSEVLKTVPWKNDWRFLSGWIDDENLVIELDESQPASLLLLNPFTGESRTLHPDFPKIYKIDAHLDWDGWGETIYNSAMSKVIYATEYGFTLWDLQVQQEIITIPALTSFDSMNKVPKWSPDGTRFIVAAPINPEDDKLYKEELFSVGLNGEIFQLTHLTSFYQRVIIKTWNWSPDGCYIAFMLYLSHQSEGKFLPNESEQLAVLDTTNQEVTLYCIPVEQVSSPTDMFPARFSMASSTIPSPVWSPDSAQLLIENRYNDNASRLILIDITKNFATQIGENVEPIGWIASRP